MTLMAAKKKAADERSTAEVASTETTESVVEGKRETATTPITRTTTYLAPGQPAKVERDDPSLDPDLEKARDEEAARNAEVKVEPRQEPTIDEALVHERDEQIKRETERAQNQK